VGTEGALKTWLKGEVPNSKHLVQGLIKDIVRRVVGMSAENSQAPQNEALGVRRYWRWVDGNRPNKAD
jgi:hypothetical protein